MLVQFLGQENPLEKGMATHSSILAWKMPWTEEPEGLQFLGSQRVGLDLGTRESFWISEKNMVHGTNAVT